MIEAFKEFLVKAKQERKDGKRITQYDLDRIAEQVNALERQAKELIERDKHKKDREQND
jgi:hypothetical protein